MKDIGQRLTPLAGRAFSVQQWEGQMRRRWLLPALALATGCTPDVPKAADNTERLADNLNATADNMDAIADNMTAAAEAVTNETQSKNTGNWSYQEDRDEMRGGTKKVASVSSDDTLELGFPYGSTTPVLNIRRDPKFGFDIYVTSDGQPLCRSYQDDTVSVKFDSGPVREWSCAEASDGSPGIVFFNSESAFLDHIRKAKKLTIEINYYDAGRQQFSFPVEGLNW